MHPSSFLETAAALLNQPTAPFHETAVRAEIERQLEALPHVRTKRDAFGNLIAQYQRGAGSPRFAFAAHMDHPGFSGEEFLGGVPAAYLAKRGAGAEFWRVLDVGLASL